MSTASQLVSSLLEDDEAQIGGNEANDPGAYVDDPASYLDAIASERESGKLTVYNADDYHTFYHRTATYRDGVTPIQVRRNGRTKRWKTRPKEFQIPVKYGLKECFYITQSNADEWSTVPIERHAKPKVKKPRKPRASLPANMIPPAAAALPERPAPSATLSPAQYSEWEREQAKKVQKPPPEDHPELPL